MSHEIRTPMNAVIGMLELTLKRMDQGHLDRSSIETAYSSAKDLLELIGDILDIARIESGHLSLSPERVNPGEIVASVVRIFDGLARQKNLRLLLEFNPPQPPVDVMLDLCASSRCCPTWSAMPSSLPSRARSKSASTCFLTLSPDVRRCRYRSTTVGSASANRISSGCSNPSPDR